MSCILCILCILVFKGRQILYQQKTKTQKKNKSYEVTRKHKQIIKTRKFFFWIFLIFF